MDTKGGSQERRYLQFASAAEGTDPQGKPILNKYSSSITRGHDFPGAQVGGAQHVKDACSDESRLCSTQLVCQTRRQ